MGPTRLFLPKTCYRSRVPMTEPGYGTSDDDYDVNHLYYNDPISYAHTLLYHSKNGKS